MGRQGRGRTTLMVLARAQATQAPTAPVVGKLA